MGSIIEYLHEKDRANIELRHKELQFQQQQFAAQAYVGETRGAYPFGYYDEKATENSQNKALCAVRAFGK